MLSIHNGIATLPWLLVLLLPSARAREAAAAGGAPRRGRGECRAEVSHGHQLLQQRSSKVRTSAWSSQGGGAIPKIAFLVAPWYPAEVTEHNTAFFPHGTEFRYYDYHQANISAQRVSQELEAAGVAGAGEAVQSLRPYAFRFDLWRLMMLWDHGGVYLDAKIRLLEPVSAWVDHASDEIAVCRDMSSNTMYHNGILAARARDPGVLNVIRRIVANVRKRFYPAKPWNTTSRVEITGPGVLTAALQEAGVHPRMDCMLYSNGDFRSRQGMWDVGGGKLLASWDNEVHMTMKGCALCNSYGELWDQHAVYCDEPVDRSHWGAAGDPCLQPGQPRVQERSAAEFWSRTT